MYKMKEKRYHVDNKKKRRLKFHQHAPACFNNHISMQAIRMQKRETDRQTNRHRERKRQTERENEKEEKAVAICTR